MSGQDLFSQLSPSMKQCPFIGEDIKFLPRNVLEETITKEVVRNEIPWHIRLTASGLTTTVAEKARGLFAILVIVGEAVSIKKLVKEGLTDEDLPFSLSKDNVLESKLGRKFKSSEFWSKGAKAASFIEKQWLVLAPVLDIPGTFISLPSKCPLPFSEGHVVGDSNYSKVYKSELHAAHYRKPKEAKTLANLTVAVKVFTKAEHFVKERENLEQIRGLNDSHLIQHLLCCERPDTFYYIIFPWADGGNLREFWQENEPTSGLTMWLLQQMLGITQVLCKLHLLNCRHGDLKPENILHFSENGLGKLVVADVGVSRIHGQVTMMRKEATLTKATTPSYEPPEVYLYQNEPRARRYDIWSTACIFLECVIWMLHGHGAIASFTRERDAPDASFFRKAPGNTKGVDIHPKVLEAIDALRQDPRCGSNTALGAVLDLISRDMLLIPVKERIRAGELHDKLEEIVQRAAQTPSYLALEGHQVVPTPRIFQSTEGPSSNLPPTSTSVRLQPELK